MAKCVNSGAAAKWIPPEAMQYFAPCEAVNRSDFDFMGYTLRTDGNTWRICLCVLQHGLPIHCSQCQFLTVDSVEWRLTQWYPWLPNMTANLEHPAGTELYSHANDTNPFEIEFEFKNLVHDTAYSKVLEMLTGQLKHAIINWQEDPL